MSGACSGSIKSWPCIAVPQGSAHFPTNPLETFADALSQIDFDSAKESESLAKPLPTYFGAHFGGVFVWKNSSCSLPVKIDIYLHFAIKSFFQSHLDANGHITLNTPVLVRSLKLSNVELSQYLDGWPPGNTGCCWLFVNVLLWLLLQRRRFASCQIARRLQQSLQVLTESLTELSKTRASQ